MTARRVWRWGPRGSAVVVVAIAVVPGCSDAVEPPVAVTSTTTTSTSTTTVTTTTVPPSTVATTSVPPATVPPATVPPATGTGVPGLDSDDAFCAAWSRFGGSWQVLQVAANFGPDPGLVPLLEVVASPVVTSADDAMYAAWPDRLAGERRLVADGFFGPFSRRSEVALESLVDAGAGPAELDAIGAAWVAALAGRSPDSPVVDVELSDDLSDLVRSAADGFDARLVGFLDDPSLIITVATPLTDAFLATSCPDRGTLSGGEIVGG